MADRYERTPKPGPRPVSERVFIPKWVITVIPLATATIGLASGIVATTWKVRTVFDGLNASITAQAVATASLSQTIDQTVKPALVEVTASAAKIAAHDTRLAVIESTCCGGSGKRSTIGDAK